jgi:hypothetical protein
MTMRQRPGTAAGVASALAIALACAHAAAAADPTSPPAGQLFVTTAPAGAVVSCDGVLRDVSPLKLTDLRPGPHLVSATKQGFLEARRTVDVRPNETVAVELALDPVLGLVLIHSTPMGSDVQIDGAFRGKTPLLVPDLPIGRYRVQVAKPGHSSREVELIVKDRVPVKLDVSLLSTASTLAISSEPSGAALTVDGIGKGTTPCTLDDVVAGDHVIEVSLEGYDPFRQTVRTQAGRSETVSVVLKAVPSELQVLTTPPGADVYIENQLRGQSPLALRDLKAGRYRVRVQMDGYDIMARDVSIDRGQRLIEKFGLLSIAGGLEITTLPPGVRVLLDGKEVGVTPAKPNEPGTASEPLRAASVPIGKHQIELVKHGFATRVVPVEIKQGETTKQHFELARKFTPDYEIITPTASYKGMLLEKDAQGNIKLELRPGVVKNIPAAEVRMAVPIPP